MQRRARQRFSDPDMEDTDHLRRRRIIPPVLPTSAATAEPVFFNDMRALNRKYGRNFRNLIRKRIEDRTFLLREPKFETYLEDFPIEDLLLWLQETLTNAWSWAFQDFFYLRSETDHILSEKEEMLKKLEQFDEREDWEEWHKSILLYCLYLNERYPQHFWMLLQDFIAPIHKGLMKPANAAVASQELQGQEDSGRRCRGGEEAFRKWLEIIDGYKHSEFCGQLFKVLEPWLLNAKVALNNSLTDFYPQFLSLKPTQHGALPGNLPKMEILHEPVFREIRHSLKIRMERPAYDEPLLTEGHPDYNTERERNKRLSSGEDQPQRVKNKNHPTPPKSSFIITRPFPSKGGFKAKVLKNDKLEIAKKSNFGLGSFI